jgi:holo-ACP synthase CitX
VITLQQLLASRDERAARQGALLRGHPGKALVCLTVIPPGSEKRTDWSVRVGNAGVLAVREGLAPSWEECHDLETGYEAYFLVDGNPLDVKQKCCSIEDTHPWGRLMDIDVLETGPGGVVPLSRSAVGLPARKCLVCDRPARECMRERTHSLEQLQEKIKFIYDSGGPLR